MDKSRVEHSQERLPDAEIRQGDCDGWLFQDAEVPFAVADFDAYCYPYHAFRSFWTNAQKCARVVMFFTDGERQNIVRSGYPTLPDGTRLTVRGITANARRGYYNFWLLRYALPYVTETIQPYKVVSKAFYNRAQMVYWGCVVER